MLVLSTLSITMFANRVSQLDFCHDNSTLEVVGSDYYWDLTTGEIHRGESGPVAINMKLGWVFAGPAHIKHHVNQQGAQSRC